MEIIFENLRDLVNKLPLDFTPYTLIYRDTTISINPELSIMLNGRNYSIVPMDNETISKNKAIGLPLYKEGIRFGGSILFYNKDQIKQQRGYILHELTELELCAIGINRDQAHFTAQEFEMRFINGRQKLLFT